MTPYQRKYSPYPNKCVLTNKKVLYDAFKHVYSFEKDGHKVALAPLESSLISKHVKWVNRLLLIEKGDFQKLSYVLDHEKYFGRKFVMESMHCHGLHQV